MSLPVETMSYNIVSIPCPGRGHINPMLNLCKRIALCRPHDLIITFVVTEEWLGLIESEPKPDNIRFATIPNVIPSGADYHEISNAIQTKMIDPVEQLLHRMNVPLINVLICDTYLAWALELGKRMDIPVAFMFNMFATMFSIFYHYNLLVQNGHVGDNNFLEKADEIVDYIPGVSRTRVADLGTLFLPTAKTFLQLFLESMVAVSKAQFLIFVSVYELERQAIDVLRSNLPIPVYTIGPATVPHYDKVKNDQDSPHDYIKWLDCQPEASVLYISQGSHLSVSSAQLDEIIAGVHDSGVPYMWIARGDETSRFEHEKGLVIPWCDQLKVLCHTSVGAFWSHCGMNSTMEGAFSGVPMLTFPIGGDQNLNSKTIVEDWKIGRRVLGKSGVLVTREEIAKLITSFMDRESEEGKEMRKRATEVKKICQQAISEGGSAHTQLDSIISDMLTID